MMLILVAFHRLIAAERATDPGAALPGADVVSLHPALCRSCRARFGGTGGDETRRNRGRHRPGWTGREGGGDPGPWRGPSWGAGTRVFAAQPPGADHPLFSPDQIVPNSQNAAMTVRCAERMAIASAHNLPVHLAGRIDPAPTAKKDALQ